MRIDKFLWFSRLSKTRGAAQTLAEQGMIRLDGRRVEKASAIVRMGSVLTLPHKGQARVLRIVSLPSRRGPPGEAALLVEEIASPSPERGVDGAPARK